MTNKTIAVIMLLYKNDVVEYGLCSHMPCAVELNVDNKQCRVR